nr:putative replicating factor [Micropterus salmoides ranavirus]WHA35633.1 putative replicating factor [Siniperca chuatsi ranavirus]
MDDFYHRVADLDKLSAAQELLLTLYEEADKKLLDYKTWKPPRRGVHKRVSQPTSEDSAKLAVTGYFSGLEYPRDNLSTNPVNVNKMCCWVNKFKDCLRKYQALQSCKISNSVLSELDAKFTSYNLTVPGAEGFVRYGKITKQHVATLLKELRYSKHYENVNLIYYILTDKRVNVQHLEKDLIKDFKLLVQAAYRCKQEHMINVKYMLYQLLRKHGNEPDRPDMLTVKTGNKGSLYDDSFRKIYSHLGWPFTIM